MTTETAEQTGVLAEVGLSSAVGANLSALLGACAETATVCVVFDDLSTRLDEMADLCEHWKRWREERDYTPTAVRSALVMIAREVVALHEMEQKHWQRKEQIASP